MRFKLIVITFLLITVLSSCHVYEFDFEDFEDRTVTTFFEAEHQPNNRYVLYYFDTSKSDLDTIKREVLPFFDSFYMLPYTFLDMSEIDTETSSFITQEDDQYIIVYAGDEVIELYEGEQGVSEFIEIYQSIEFDYSLFADQHINSVLDLLTIEEDDYIVYSYSEESCDACEELKDTFLPWAFSKPENQIYFLNRDTVSDLDLAPIELFPITVDEPAILVMTNGIATREYYVSYLDVLQYMDQVTDGPIEAQFPDLDYEDFTEQTLSSFDALDTIGSDRYLLYIYSPYCAHCASIKELVLPFFVTLYEIPFYIINISSVSGTNPIEGFIGVPSMFLIEDGNVIESYIGSLAIPNMIEDYEEGLVSFE